MKLFGILKKITGFDDQDKTLSKRVSNDACLVRVKLDKYSFRVLAREYYKGTTSYKTIFKNVFDGDGKKTIETMNIANDKAQSGCDIESTFVQFYMSDHEFIEIPFIVYSDKKDMTVRIRNTTTWNRNNILRILRKYPEFRRYDSEVVLENKAKQTI